MTESDKKKGNGGGVAPFAGRVRKARELLCVEAMNAGDMLSCLDEGLPLGLEFTTSLNGFKIQISIEEL